MDNGGNDECSFQKYNLLAFTSNYQITNYDSENLIFIILRIVSIIVLIVCELLFTRFYYYEVLKINE